LAPFIAEVLEENDLLGGEYAEPYCGGAGIAIALLLSRKVTRIYLNDCCRPVFAFWKSIITEPESFCRKVSGASLTIREWERQREIMRRPDEFDDLTLGFSVFYMNRCNRSGILGAGVIGGKNQTGKWKIDARFPRKELVRRIEAIALFRSKIRVSNLDAEDFIRLKVPKLNETALVYCDPPYFEKAERLYLNIYKPDDHFRIAKTIQENLVRPWLVSYDHAPQITEAYRNRRHFRYDLQYSAGPVHKGSEVFFLSDDLKLPSKSSVPCIDAAL
jgi:DNA adenine methylase